MPLAGTGVEIMAELDETTTEVTPPMPDVQDHTCTLVVEELVALTDASALDG